MGRTKEWKNEIAADEQRCSYCNGKLTKKETEKNNQLNTPKNELICTRCEDEFMEGCYSDSCAL